MEFPHFLISSHLTPASNKYGYKNISVPRSSIKPIVDPHLIPAKSNTIAWLPIPRYPDVLHRSIKPSWLFLLLNMKNLHLPSVGSCHRWFVLLILAGVMSISAAQTCNIGQEWSSTQCIDCVGGKYQNQNTVSTSCKSCGAGQFSAAKETLCAGCPTGRVHRRFT